MEHQAIILKLAANRLIFTGLLKGAEKEEYTWRPEETKWDLLKIACHLYDEEREDFRARLKQVLETPENPLPKINPEGWVKERKYAEWNYNETVEKFLTEREQSVKWLSTLQNPNWKNAYTHHKYGPLTAEMFLANWLAHDYLHIRQILHLKYHYLKQQTSEVTLDYAGKW